MNYISKHSLIALIIAAQSSPAHTQNALSIASEAISLRRVILTISSKSDWEFEVNDNNSVIIVQNGVIEGQVSQNLHATPSHSFEISGKINPISNTFEISCSCVLSVERHEDDFLIVDISDTNAEQSVSIFGSDTHLTSDHFHKWWESPSFASRHRDLLSNTLTNYATQRHRKNGSGEDSNMITLEEDESSRKLQPTETNDLRNPPPRIGVLSQQINSDEVYVSHHDCPLKELYRTTNEPPHRSRSDELLFLRNEIQNPNGSQNTEALLKYSQQLFALGLTREARQILNMIDEKEFEITTLEKVIKIASGVQGIQFNELEFKICSGQIELWDFLANAAAPLNRGANSLVILQFKSLQPHIQSQIIDIFLPSLRKSNNHTEILAFMDTQSGDPSSRIFVNADNTTNAERNLLRQANRDNPLKVIDLLQTQIETDPDQLVALSKSLRSQLRGTTSWIDIMDAEITFDIENGQLRSAISKINLLISKETPAEITQPKIDQFIDAFLNQASPKEALSLHLSGLLSQWPIDIQNLLSRHVNELGLNDLRDDTNLKSVQWRIRPGYVVGPNERHFPSSDLDYMQTNLTPQRVQQTLSEVKNFKQELLLSLQSD